MQIAAEVVAAMGLILRVISFGSRKINFVHYTTVVAYGNNDGHFYLK